MAESDGVIIPFIPDFSRLDVALKSTIQQLQQTGEITDATAAKFTAAFAGMAENTKAATTETNSLVTGVKNLNQNLAGGAIKEAATDTAALGDALQETGTKVKTLTGQIRANRNALAEMALAGNEGTEAFKKLEKENAKLNLTMRETRERIGNMSKEFRGLGAAQAGVRSLSTSMQGAAGIALLFGTANEKAMEKVQFLMGATMGLNSVMELSNEFKRSGTIGTYAFAAAEKVQQMAAEASALAIAGVTAGIGLLVVGIGAVVVWLSNMSEEERKQKEAADELTESYKSQIRELERLIKLKKARGENTFEEEEAKATANVGLAKQSEDEARKAKLSGLSSVLVAIGLGPTRENTKEYLESIKKTTEATKDAENDVTLVKEDAEKKRLKNLDEYNKLEMEATKHGIELKKAQFDDETDQMAIARSRSRTSLGYSDAENTADDKNLRGNRQKIWDEEYRKWTLEQDRKMWEGKIAIAKEGTADLRNAEVGLAQANYNVVGQAPKGTYSPQEIGEAKAQLTKATLDANKKYFEAIQEQTDQYQAKELQNEIDNLELKRAEEVKGSDEDLAFFKQIQEKKLQLAIISNAKIWKNNSEGYKNFQKKQEQEYQTYHGQALKADMDSDKKAQDELTKNEIWQLEMAKQFHVNKKKLDEMYAKEHAAHPNESSDETRKRNQLELEEKKKQEDEIKKVALDYAKQTSDAIFTAENDARNKKYDLEISRLEKTKDFELDNKNLTEAQKISIQRKFDKEVASIKLQQWKADQKSKEEQALINGALAITNALATSPWPINVILAAGALATSVSQAAVIAAQKPPQFAEGTPAGKASTPHGLKLVGEEGPELIYTAGGERIIPAGPTEEILRAYAIPHMPSVSAEMLRDAGAPGLSLINEKSLAKEIAAEMSKNPVALVNVDKDGITTHMVQKGSKRTILNGKFRT